MPQDFTNDKSTLLQVMAWCRQATSHYLGQCWPRSILPNGVARPQRVNFSRDVPLSYGPKLHHHCLHRCSSTYGAWLSAAAVLNTKFHICPTKFLNQAIKDFKPFSSIRCYFYKQPTNSHDISEHFQGSNLTTINTAWNRKNITTCVMCKLVINYRNRGKISIRCWISFPIPRPNLWGVLCEYLWEN